MATPTLSRLLAKLFARPQSRRDRRRAARLGLEPLEGRDVPAVSFTVEGLSNAAEGGAAGQFRVTANGDASDFTTAVYAVWNPLGTAGLNSDYTSSLSVGSYLVFSAPGATAAVTITAVDDAAVEGTEIVGLRVQRYQMFPTGPTASDNISLYDNDTTSPPPPSPPPPPPPLPVVSVTNVADATEGGANGVFLFTRTGDTSADLTVSFMPLGGGSGDATAGTDYTALGVSVTIPAGNSTATVEVAAAGDGVEEPSEYVRIEVSESTTYTVATANAQVTIIDVTNHPPVLAPVPDQTVNVGEWYEYQLVASDPDGDTLTYTADGLPPGLSVDPGTGLVSGTPLPLSEGAPSTYPVTFTVADGRGGVAQQAANFQFQASWLVNTPQDTNDANLNDNVPLDVNGKISLRAAMEQAATFPQGVTIGFDPAVFPNGGNIAVATRLVSANAPITINGRGRGLVISGATGNGIFWVRPNTTLTIKDLTIQGGTNIGNGGGVVNEGALTLTNVAVKDCHAVNGGGVYSTGGLTMTDCEVANNGTAPGGFGAGVDVSSGVAAITYTEFRNNVVQGRGGAIAVRNTGTQVAVSSSLIAYNQASHGGGLYVSGGNLTATTSTIRDNTASVEGGGLFHGGGTTFLDRVVTLHNSATQSGGGWYVGSGTVIVNQGSLEDSSAADGGGLYTIGGTVSISGTAIHRNAASGWGGGIFARDGSISLTTVDFFGNTAANGPKIGRQVGMGGALPPIDLDQCTGVAVADIVNKP